MRVLVVHSHPQENSFGKALYRQTCESLKKAGHEVDGCDLYAEGFDPVLSTYDRDIYHTEPDNQDLVKEHVERLRAAEGFVICTPVWNFGFPAMMKGYFDRVWLPGVAFKLDDGKLTPDLRHIKKMAAVMTYGADRMRAFLAGDPPRKLIMRTIRYHFKWGAPAKYLAHYDMNNATPESTAAFMQKVSREMERF